MVVAGRKRRKCLLLRSCTHPCSAPMLFYLKTDICQLGMDQRKVNMLAREYCDVAEPKIKHKPVIVSHRELLEFACYLHWHSDAVRYFLRVGIGQTC